MNYNLTVDDEGKGSVTFIHDGAMVTIPHTHPTFARVTHALVSGGDPTPFLDTEAALRFDPRVKVVELAETTEGGYKTDPKTVVTFNGEEIHGSLVNTIKRYHAEGRDTTGLSKFLERLSANPSKRARENLFDWVSAKDLTITPEGFFVGWKGVYDNDEFGVEDELDEELTEEERDIAFFFRGHKYKSSNSGTATVDGVTYTDSQIPYSVGSVVTMPREECNDDFTNACSTGLHVGSYNYASTFAQHVLEVEVDPADVVAVPRSETTKLRCCRFKVLDVQENPRPSARFYEAPATWNEDDLDEELEKVEVPVRFRDRLKKALGLSHES